MKPSAVTESAIRIALIWAMARNGVIGCDNALPWHLPEDLRYFKRMTLGKPVIMGRKTYQSIGRPLPQRSNIVLSRDPCWQPEGVQVVRSVEAALQCARQQALMDSVDQVMVMGGAQIYAACLPLADDLYLTQVHAQVAGDALFPPVDWQAFEEVSRTEYPADQHNPYAYARVAYRRYAGKPHSVAGRIKRSRLLTS